jgi:endonuclease/exonuclease/phosphatase family metal-dependent hydrolase
MNKLGLVVVMVSGLAVLRCGPAGPIPESSSEAPAAVDGIDADVPDNDNDLGSLPDADANALVTCPSPSNVGAPFRLRAVAANLTSGNQQSYDEGHGIRIMKGLKPDVVLIQEYKIGNNSNSTLQAMADSVLNVTSGKAFFQRGLSGDIPNGIISRWPIVAGGDFKDSSVTNRQFTWAKIDLPGPRDLFAVSLHLLTRSASARQTEAQQLIQALRTAVPEGDFLMVGGDFNTNSRTETALSTLGSRLKVSGPFPVDQRNDGDTNSSRAKPYDWVLASPCLEANAKAASVGTSTFSAGLVFDSRVYSPLSDTPGVSSSDSASSNMQHMAVVRDFQIQP